MTFSDQDSPTEPILDLPDDEDHLCKDSTEPGRESGKYFMFRPSNIKPMIFLTTTTIVSFNAAGNEVFKPMQMSSIFFSISGLCDEYHCKAATYLSIGYHL